MDQFLKFKFKFPPLVGTNLSLRSSGLGMTKAQFVTKIEILFLQEI